MTRAMRVCEFCSANFTPTSSGHDERGQICCSRACSTKLRSSRKPVKICAACGVEFSCYASQAARTRFCSRTCRDDGFKRSGSSAWHGGEYTHTQQHVRQVLVSSRDKDMREVYLGEHRLVAAKAIGRQLKKSEPIIHVNHDRTDNRPDNLFVCRSVSELRHRYSGVEPWPVAGNLGAFK